MSITGPLRQLRYPSEFRISVPGWAPEKRLTFETLIERLSAPPPAAPSAHEEDYARIVVNLANRLWTFRRQLMPQEITQPPEELRRLHRPFERVWNALTDAGITVMDHTNELFDSGTALVVLAFQPTPGLNRETVIETTKPSIYYQSRHLQKGEMLLLQRGEVIVGTPEMQQAAAPLTEEPAQPPLPADVPDAPPPETAQDQPAEEPISPASPGENTSQEPTLATEGDTADA